MNMKNILLASATAAALVSTSAVAEETSEEAAPQGLNWAPGEGITYNETPIVSTELSIAWDSKYLSYGLIDNPDPILTPAASITFYDWVYVGVSAVFDTTKYGHAAGYYNRAWDWTELDPEVGIAHSFSQEDAEWLPTTIDWSVAYMYEHHPMSFNGPEGERQQAEEEDTQFITVDVGLPDLWVQPVLEIEQDIARDSGTYINLELGHTFAIIDGETEDDDPVLSLTPSIAQGWGDNRRVRGYLSTASDPDEGLNRAGLMDSWLKLTADWQICDMFALSGYVAYSDYIFDRHTREAARRYEATGKYDDSFNFTCGLALTASF